VPELPEVEHYRRVAAKVAEGRSIVRAWCARDDIVFETPPREVKRALAGRQVTGAGRHGKYLWLELDRRPWPLLHFGMTGMLVAPGERELTLRSGIATGRYPGDWPPRFARLRLWLDDGGELCMTDARRLGRIRLRDDPRNEAPLSDLGFDPLLGMASARRFAAEVRRRRCPIKALLLDQGFAAGVGNWIADEVLFQSGLDPRRLAGALTDAEIERLRRAIARVVRAAVRVDAQSGAYPAGWLFHRRWAAHLPRGLERTTVAGRTTVFAPARQR
jgi:formamidopyrimidine-DNA glycosylase